MQTNPPSSPVSPAPASVPPPARKKRPWVLYILGGLFGFVLLVVATVFFTLWWIQRPIKPVVLSNQELATAEAKLQQVSGDKPASPAAKIPAAAKPPAAAPEKKAAPAVPAPEADRPYVPGSKVLTLTEREINGLLNAKTDLGKTLRIEFGRDAINAYLAVPIPEDFPVGGGKIFRARGRFKVSLGNGGAPLAMLEDITVFGLSLPKDWLGGLKGENLLKDMVGEKNGKPAIRGIKSLRIEPGALVLELED